MQANCITQAVNEIHSQLTFSFHAQVDWADLEAFDARLSEEIQRQFYVLQDFLVAALRPFIRSIEPDYVVDDMGKDKVFQLAFSGVRPHVQLRDLKTCEIGKLISIVGTVTRTGDVRPELISGTFLCLECRAEIRNVLQQFK
jgi:DNA replication licensing factor MCM6